MPEKAALGEKLREQGFRVTPQRLLVLDVLHSSQRHLSVPEIHAEIQARFPSVDISSVYRIVERFVDLGLVSRVDLGEDRRFYEWRKHDGEHYHLICQECGAVDHLVEEDLDSLRLLLLDRGFRPLGMQLTVFGYCASCQATASLAEEGAGGTDRRA